MLSQNSMIEQTPDRLQVTFTAPSPTVELIGGIALTSMSGCSVVISVLFLLPTVILGLVIALSLLSQISRQQLMNALPALLLGGIGVLVTLVLPLLAFGGLLFFGLRLLRRGNRPVVCTAEVWIFDQSQRQLSVMRQYHDRRSQRRWSELMQNYPLPPAQAIRQRLSTSDHGNSYWIEIQMGQITLKSFHCGSGVLQAIQQFLTV